MAQYSIQFNWKQQILKIPDRNENAKTYYCLLTCENAPNAVGTSPTVLPKTRKFEHLEHKVLPIDPGAQSEAWLVIVRDCKCCTSCPPPFTELPQCFGRNTVC